MPSKIKKIKWYLINQISNFICNSFPYSLGPILANVEYKRIFGKNLNLKKPTNLIEKIIWLQFHSDTSMWTKCADKYEVRSFVKQKGLEKILPKIYGVWEDPNEIEFDNLPQKFVLKTNNSCGQNIIVKDKSKLNIKETRDKLEKWLKDKYGSFNGQLHYLKIKPKIIAEELLEDEMTKNAKSLIDYKIWCFDGQPELIWTCQNRTKNRVEVAAFDTKWNYHPEVSIFNSHFVKDDNRIEKPESLENMLEIAAKLSEGFPQVRIDLYEINGEPVFGEMTFTTGYGFFTEEFYNYLGSKIDLSKVKKR